MEGSSHRNRNVNVVFWALFVLLTGVSLLPLWSVRVPPMQDIWQHLALVDVIHNYDAPGSVYPEYFQLPSTPKPNLAYYYVTHFVSYLAPLETANKLVLSAYIILFPCSFLFLMRSFGRSRWLALFSFPLIYNAMFAYGFVAFMMGMPVLMAGVGAFRRFMVSPLEQPFNRHGVLSAGLLLLAFFAHAHIFLLLGMLCLVLWILHRPGTPWDTLVRTWPVIPSLVFFLPWFVVYFVHQAPSTSGMTFGSLDQFFGPTYYRPSFVINNFFHFISDYFRTDLDDALFLVMMLVVVILLMGRKAPKVPPNSKRKLAFFDLEVLTVALAVSVLAVPEHIEAQSIVSLRHVAITLLFFFGWVGFAGLPKRVVIPAVVALTLVHGLTIVNLVQGFKKVEDELDDYPSLFDRAEGGKRLLKAVYNQESRTTDYGAFWHIHFFYMLERGGITDVQFAEYPHNPVQYKAGMVPPKVPVNFTKNPVWRFYDYVLLRKSSMPNIRSVKDHLDRLADVRDWILYRVVSGPLPRPSDDTSVASVRRKQVDSSGALNQSRFRSGGIHVPAAVKNIGHVIPSVTGVLRRGRGEPTDGSGTPAGRVGRPVRSRVNRSR